MTQRNSLQIAAHASDPPLTLEQERFNFLIAKIETVRKSHAEWDVNIFKFRQDAADKLQPLRAKFTAVSRDTVFAIDRLLDQKGWSRPDRADLQELLCGTAELLLEVNDADIEIKSVYDRHSTVDFDASKQDDLQRLKEEAEAYTGLDLGDADEIRTEEDLVRRMYEEMSAREAAEAADAGTGKRGGKPASRRAEENARQARHSLREIFRRLVSAVHPDREPDPQRRREKTELMQKINQAYAANDLLTLFQAQLQIEQIDAGHIRQLSMQRLRHYNKLLAEQLSQLRTRLDEMKTDFCTDYGLPPSTSFDTQKFTMVLRRQARSIRNEIERQQQFLRLLANKGATRRWLKQQRHEGALFDDESF